MRDELEAAGECFGGLFELEVEQMHRTAHGKIERKICAQLRSYREICAQISKYHSVALVCAHDPKKLLSANICAQLQSFALICRLAL